MDWRDYKKKDLLALPKRNWGLTTEYYAVLLISTRSKHDSGYAWFAVVGCKDGCTPTELVGYMDDFRNEDLLPNFGIDCSLHGVFRLHSLNHGRNYIRVGANLNSTGFSVGSEVKKERK
jgi:hypothetical protein